MKSSFLFILFQILLQNITLAQTILPVSKSFQVKKSAAVAEYKKISDSTSNAISLLTLEIKSDSSLSSTMVAKTDSLKNIQKAARALELKSLADALSDNSPVIPIVTAGISNLENTKQSYGSISLGLLFRLSKYSVTNKGWIDPHFVYLIFSSKTATSPDSTSIQKTFMFPELNKRDFVFGYYWQFLKNDWTIAPSFEFSLNRFTDTASEKKFISQSFNLGVRFQKSFSFENVNSFISLHPYYSLITVDKKYSVDYQQLIGEEKIPSTFHSIGLNISTQLPHAIMFCNMKYILNKEEQLKSNDLKTFIYTIGTLINL